MTNPDFRDLFSAFNAAEVRYVVVGAYAVIHHSEPRYTKDLDVWVEPAEANARRVLAALAEFGAPLAGLGVEDLCNPKMVYQIGIEPNRIDVLMGITGLDFASAWARAEVTSYTGVPIRVLGLEDIIAAKRAAGRPQDMLDLEKLEKVMKNRKF